MAAARQHTVGPRSEEGGIARARGTRCECRVVSGGRIRSAADEGDAEYVCCAARVPPITAPSLDIEAQPLASAVALATVDDYPNPCHASEADSQIVVERRLPARNDDEKHPRYCDDPR